MQLKTEIVRITPAMAQKWLDTANQNNRNLRHGLAEKYARDMEHGNWDVTHQGIAFYDDGTLADGQHRLKAITLSNKTVSMMVTKNLPRKTSQAIDQNAPRQMHDVIHIAGGPAWVDKDVIAVARTVLIRFNHRSNNIQSTPSEVIAYVNKYSEQLRFVASLTPSKKRYLTTAVLSANYLCALVAGEPREKLKRFAEIMVTGEIVGQHENAAIRLREYLLANTAAWSGTDRLETAKKAQKALMCFCSDKPLSRLYTPDEFIYPVPL